MPPRCGTRTLLVLGFGILAVLELRLIYQAVKGEAGDMEKDEGDDICDENGLAYYICYRTQLHFKFYIPAVRQRSFHFRPSEIGLPAHGRNTPVPNTTFEWMLFSFLAVIHY